MRKPKHYGCISTQDWYDGEVKPVHKYRTYNYIGDLYILLKEMGGCRLYDNDENYHFKICFNNTFYLNRAKLVGIINNYEVEYPQHVSVVECKDGSVYVRAWRDE